MSAGPYLPGAIVLAASRPRWWRIMPRRRPRRPPYAGPIIDPRILRDALEKKLEVSP